MVEAKVPVATAALARGFPWNAVYAAVPLLCPHKRAAPRPRGALLILPMPDRSLKQFLSDQESG